MEQMKKRFIDAVAAKLVRAPHSTAKEELIEELSDNLYRRFLDMTGAGMEEETAFQRALDDLGDVDELLSYLGVEPAPDVIVNDGDSQTQIKMEHGQARITTQDGRTVIISNPDSRPLTINTGNEAPPQAGQDAPADGQPQGWTDQRGDPHCDYSAEASQSDLDAILAGVSEVCNTAIDQAKAALKQAKEAMKRRTTVQRDGRRVSVHFNSRPDASPPPPHDGPAPHAPPPPPPFDGPAPHAPPPPPPFEEKGWEFEAELDSDQGRFFAGAGPKERKDVVYGFGYDKARGGFFTQWGEYHEYQDEDPETRGPRFYGEDGHIEHQDDGSYSVTALRDLRGIEVFTVAGDVTIHDSEAPDAGVIIDGDVDDLDVTCSADGVLTIREGRTASSSFFSRRGIGSADVELSLPRRLWETIVINTTSGDVELDGRRVDVSHLDIRTASGDVTLGLRSCGELRFRSASGDLDLELESGRANLQAETMSGDITLRGQMDSASLKTASGDIEAEGPARRFLGHSMSGDVRLESSAMPQVLEISSKSGDCEARLPDAGPFSLRMKTVSGEIDCAFPLAYVNGVFVYGDGSGPAYSMTSVSGSVSLERY